MLSLLLAAALQGGCADPALAALTPPSAPDTAPGLDAPYDPLRGFDPAVALGIGHLQIVGDAKWPWWHAARLPLFDAPGGSPTAWIVDGWWVPPTGAARPLALDGLLETGYEIPTFILMERRDDGWLQIRVARGDEGIVWVPECRLDAGSVALAVEEWGPRFLSDEVSPLFFRQAERHPMRAARTDDAPVTRWVPANSNEYALLPLEIDGDWMRARLSEPSDYCEEPERPPRVTEGWVRWRDATGPLVWYSTRGC